MPPEWKPSYRPCRACVSFWERLHGLLYTSAPPGVGLCRRSPSSSLVHCCRPLDPNFTSTHLQPASNKRSATQTRMRTTHDAPVPPPCTANPPYFKPRTPWRRCSRVSAVEYISACAGLCLYYMFSARWTMIVLRIELRYRCIILLGTALLIVPVIPFLSRNPFSSILVFFFPFPFIPRSMTFLPVITPTHRDSAEGAPASHAITSPDISITAARQVPSPPTRCPRLRTLCWAFSMPGGCGPPGTDGLLHRCCFFFSRCFFLAWEHTNQSRLNRGGARR